MNWTKSQQNSRLEFYDCPPYEIQGTAGPDDVFVYEAFFGKERLSRRDDFRREFTLQEAKDLCEGHARKRARVRIKKTVA